MENGDRNGIGEAAGPAEQEPCATAGEGRDGAWRCLLQNLGCGVRLALFRRVAPAELCAAPADLALLAAVDLLLNLALSFLLAGSGGEFAPAALASFFFHLPPMLLLGLLAGRHQERPVPVAAIPVALVALSLPIELSHGVLECLARLPRLERLADYLDAPHYYRFFWWWAAAASLFVARLAPATLRRLALLLTFLALLVTPLWFFPRGDIWVSAARGQEGGELHLTEEVLAAQARLLDRELQRLLPGERGNAGIYFVGFAGDSGQDVFTRELTAAARLFGERFAAAGRTVVLANNPGTATTLPFATAANLERTLKGVGGVMNRDEDILFLFLTSHGSAEHELVVENPPLELEGLTPQALRRMLDGSGITWRVVVVSACFAGGFIDPLRDDHTLIITAADAGHESFGCSYGEDFTWFGRAYFDEALRRSRSFTEAFGLARETIRQWEEREGETPSNPQIWVGRAMAGKLAAMEGSRPAGGEASGREP